MDIVPERMFQVPEIPFQVLHMKVLQEIKDMGKPNKRYTDLLFSINPTDKFNNKHGKRFLSNWDYECHKIYCGWQPRNFALYQHNTKKELYKMACDNRITSRSNMDKKQLIQALMKS